MCIRDSYQLAATWDWDPLPVSGTLHLRPYGDFTHVTLAPGGRDKLVEGSGIVAVELSGADFEFLDKVALESSVRDAKPAEVGFTLPLGKRAGPQNSVTGNIDTAKQGSYRLLLTQSDGVAHEVPVTVLPPNPKISNLPIRLNMGEKREVIRFMGSGMERIEAASSDAGEITGAPDPHGWSGEIGLKAGLIKGQSFPLLLKVKGLDSPVTVPDAIEIVGPRPKIVSVQKSLAGALGIEIGADELPAGTAAGLVLTVNHLRDTTRPRLDLGCETGELRQSLTISPSEASSAASLTLAGPGALYLSCLLYTSGRIEGWIAITCQQDLWRSPRKTTWGVAGRKEKAGPADRGRGRPFPEMGDNRGQTARYIVLPCLFTSRRVASFALRTADSKSEVLRTGLWFTS